MSSCAVVWLGSAIALTLLVATFGGPGYVDSEYAYHVAANLAAGRGLTADVIWTYLTDPAGLPLPSHLYWMPLTSLLAAPFLALFGTTAAAGQIPFVLLGAAVPAATTWVAGRVLRSRWEAIVAGLLTLFSGYYFLYWAALDAFAVFTLAAGATFLATAGLLGESGAGRKGGDRWSRNLGGSAGGAVRQSVNAPGGARQAATNAGPAGGNEVWWGLMRRSSSLGVVLGAATAAAHYARADGPLLLVSTAVTLAVFGRGIPARRAFGTLAIAGGVYAVLLLPWWVRNALVAGTPWPGAGLRTIFLREYSDIFAYGVVPGPAEYLAQGVPAIVQAKVAAAGQNLLVLFGGAYWLAPLSLVGWWSLRRSPLFRPPLVYGLLLYLVMSFVFTEPGTHGSFVHSAAALVPWLAIAAVAGLDRVLRWLAVRRAAWRGRWAGPVAGCALIVATAVAAVVLASGAVRTRDQQVREYAALAATIPAATVFALDPPGWWYASGGRAAVTPSNGPDAALEAARRFGVTHLVWQPGYPATWQGIDADPRFDLVAERGEIRVYRLVSGATR